MNENLFFVQITDGREEYLFALLKEDEDCIVEDVLETCLESHSEEDKSKTIDNALKELKKHGSLNTIDDKFISKKDSIADYLVREKTMIEGENCDMDTLYLNLGYDKRKRKQIKNKKYGETPDEEVYKTKKANKESKNKPKKQASNKTIKSKRKKPWLSKRTKNTIKAAGFILYTGFMMYCMNRCDEVYYKHKYEGMHSTDLYDILK